MRNSLGQFGLREEARKLWDYIITNRFVYQIKFTDINLDAERSIPKQYLNGLRWMEFHITHKFGGGLNHYLAALENGYGGTRRGFHGNGQDRSMSGDFPMLVNVAEFVEFPENVIPIGIPSVVRLQRFDNGDCMYGYELIQ